MRILPYRGDTERSGVVMMPFDVTGGIKQAEDRFRYAVETAPSGMLMMDRSGQITLFRPSESSFISFPGGRNVRIARGARTRAWSVTQPQVTVRAIITTQTQVSPRRPML